MQRKNVTRITTQELLDHNHLQRSYVFFVKWFSLQIAVICMTKQCYVRHSLSPGSLYVQCCARFLLVKCQLTASSQNQDKSRRETGN